MYLCIFCTGIIVVGFNTLNLNDRSLNNSHWSDDTVVINFTFLE